MSPMALPNYFSMEKLMNINARGYLYMVKLLLSKLLPSLDSIHLLLLGTKSLESGYLLVKIVKIEILRRVVGGRWDCES